MPSKRMRDAAAIRRVDRVADRSCRDPTTVSTRPPAVTIWPSRLRRAGVKHERSGHRGGGVEAGDRLTGFGASG